MTKSKYKFNWNDTVLVARDAPAKFRPLEIAAVVGMRSVENEVQALAAGFPIETVLCMIEFSDGIIIEVPESYLRTRPAPTGSTRQK